MNRTLVPFSFWQSFLVLAITGGASCKPCKRRTSYSLPAGTKLMELRRERPFGARSLLSGLFASRGVATMRPGRPRLQGVVCLVLVCLLPSVPDGLLAQNLCPTPGALSSVSKFPVAAFPLQPGMVAATCFSGFENPNNPQQMDLDAFVVAVVDGRVGPVNPPVPSVGENWCAPCFTTNFLPRFTLGAPNSWARYLASPWMITSRQIST